MPHLIAHHYGKSDVRVTKVVRNAERHDLWEFRVQTTLGGDFQDCYLEGDNSRVIPTDTMRNTAYALARRHEFRAPEEYADLLARHYLDRFAQVSAAEIAIESSLWAPIHVDDRPSPHAFRREAGIRLTRVLRRRGGTPEISGGIRDLFLLKTTGSGFRGFVRDEFTTLADTDDRILATRLEAEWRFSAPGSDANLAFSAACAAIEETFAVQHSLAVQQTVYAIGEAILARVAEIVEVRIAMPNEHRILYNLEALGMDNPQAIYVATSEPYGMIEGTVRRDKP